MGKNREVVYDEASLIEALRKQQREGQELLVKRFGPAIRATALRYLRNEQDAADAVQETLIQVLASIDRFEGRSTLKSWIFSITANVALRQLRRVRRRQETPLDDHHLGEPPVPSPSLEQDAATDEIVRHVREAVGTLPERHKTIITLRDLQGASTREAALALGVSETAARVRLHRARRALRASCEEVPGHEELLL